MKLGTDPGAKSIWGPNQKSTQNVGTKSEFSPKKKKNNNNNNNGVLTFNNKKIEKITGCFVCIFKQQFSVFKQHYTYFHTLFHPHVFLHMFLNNNCQFLNTYTKRTLRFCTILLIKENKQYWYYWITRLNNFICNLGCC